MYNTYTLCINRKEACDYLYFIDSSTKLKIVFRYCFSSLYLFIYKKKKCLLFRSFEQENYFRAYISAF